VTCENPIFWGTSLPAEGEQQINQLCAASPSQRQQQETKIATIQNFNQHLSSTLP
jgi:hypothetical protein